jgi:hypothetical protein
MTRPRKLLARHVGGKGCGRSVERLPETARLPNFADGSDFVGLCVRPDRTDMDIGSIETSDAGQKPVLCVVGQFVRLGDGEAGVSRDIGFGPKPVPNPADA